MELKDLNTFTNKLCDKDLAMFHHCLRKEWTRLSDFEESVKRSFKPYSIPTQTFNNNVHNRTELLLKELELEMTWIENLMNYTEQFFEYSKETEYHLFLGEKEKGTDHINNTI